MRRLAVAVTHEAQARGCLAHFMSRFAPRETELTIIAVAVRPVLLRFATTTGHVDPRELELMPLTRASEVALAAMAMLPSDVRATYIVCRGWEDPAMRAYLTQWQCDELVIAKRGLGMCSARLRVALRGSDVRVRCAESRPLTNVGLEGDPVTPAFEHAASRVMA